MNAWIKCPTCGGVLKAQPGISEGPCVFCETTLRVNVQVAVISEPEAVGAKDSWKDWSDEVHAGRGPLPKLTRSGKSYLG
ncbi:cysteine-rich KTR domain-containing protein [Akkermansiaceae bacterium]|nr:cysteine-rich KTR domain-containing protein [Akkermansiaceae bacterium]